MAFTEIVNAENSPVIGETVDGVQTIMSGGLTNDTTIVTGGNQTVLTGGKTDGVTMTGGTLSAMGAGAVGAIINDVSITGVNTAMQIQGVGTVANDVKITGSAFAKAEIWDGAVAYNVTVDAGAAIEMGKGKAGAYLIVTGNNAEVQNAVITNCGSASVYNGGYISDVVVSNGGVLAMSYRKLTDGTTGGVANNVSMEDGGIFWVGTLGSKAYNVTFKSGSLLSGFGAAANGTTFYTSYVQGSDGITREMANWDGGDYTVVSGLTLLMTNMTDDGTKYYTLDLSKIILQGGAIQKTATDNSFSHKDDISIRVVDPQTGEILISSISGGKATNWQVAANQRYIVDGGWGAQGSADGLIVYEGGELDTIFVGRPGPISATGGTVITNGRYIFNDGTVQNFSCGNGYAENMIVENGRFVLNGYAGTYTAATFGSGCVVKNTTMIGGMYVQGNFAISNGLTTSNNTIMQVYSYDTLTGGVNKDEAADSIYRNFSIENGVASGLIIENGGLLMLMGEMASPDGSLDTVGAGVGKNLIVRGYMPKGIVTGNNTRPDGRSYLAMGAGTAADNVIIGDGGYLDAKGINWTLSNVAIENGGAFAIAIDATTKFSGTIDGASFSWDGAALNDFVFGATADPNRLFTFTESGIAAITEVNNLVINAAGFAAGSNRVYNNVVVNATFNVGSDNVYNNVTVNDTTVLMYSKNTINGIEVSGANAFAQFTTGTITNVALWGGKVEAAGDLHINGIVIDGTEFSTPIGETADSSPDHQTTQLVAYAAGVYIENMVIRNGGSAFLYNGATANGSGNLTVLYPDGVTKATTTAGVVVENGGVLYLTNWNLDTNTSCTIEGDLWVNTGGTLYLGSNANKIGRLQTMTGANIVGIAAGTVIDSAILRGANILIDEKLTITNVIQGNSQSVDGGTIGTWMNNFGVFTITAGTVDKYVHNNGVNVGVRFVMSGGKIKDLDLSLHAAAGVAELNGGDILSGKIGAGTITDAGATGEYNAYVAKFAIGAGAIGNFNKTDLDDIANNGGTLVVGGGSTLDGLTQSGGVTDIYIAATNVDVVNGVVKVHVPSGAIDGLKVFNSTVSFTGEATDEVVLNNAYISGTGNTSFIQAMVGIGTSIVLNGGKYEALGTHRINTMIVDGSGLDSATRNQLIAYAEGVVVDNLTLINGGSAYFYNGAHVGTGTKIESGGILYLTDRNLSSGTVANIDGSISIASGGTLYMGSVNNVFGADATIQTYGGSTITGIVSGTTINNIVLRGCNINIAEGLTINNVIQGGAQSIDGGYVKKWQNNFGELTFNKGIIDTYLHYNGTNPMVALVVNGGSIGFMDLTLHGGSTKLYGGVVESATIGGGTVSDSDLLAGGVNGVATIKNVEITGGSLNIWYNGSTAENVIINGGTLQVGRRGDGFNESTQSATATNVTLNTGTVRVDGIVDTMVMSGGVISLAGGTVDGIDIYGGSIVNWVGAGSSSTIIDATVHTAVGLNAASTTWDNLNIKVVGGVGMVFGANNTFNGLTSTNSVIFGAGSVVNNAVFDSGSVVTGNTTTYNNITFKGNGTWAQIMGGSVVNGLTLVDKTKFEAAGCSVNGAIVDGAGVKKSDGSDLAFGDHKIGAHLAIYTAGAVASGVQLVNHGSATVWNGGKIMDFVATDGGALYLRGWSVSTTDTTGTAENGTITATGGIWYAGGTLKNVTIEYGAWQKYEYNVTTVMENVKIGQADGTYITINCNIAEGTGDIYMPEGSVMYGNWAVGGGLANGATKGNYIMLEGSSLVGWNLGASTATGTITIDGATTSWSMGTTNSYGGKHAQNVYIFNGSAVLGSGSSKVDEKGDVTITYNTADGLIFDNSLFVMGGMTKATNLTFRNGVSFQGYSNGNMTGINYDEAADSIYRNFSMDNGVASGVIVENGGFLQLFFKGQNWQGNTPSPSGYAKDMIIRGKRNATSGNYNAADMAAYGGGSYLVFNQGTGGENIIVGSGANIRVSNSGTVISELTMEAGAILKIDAMDDTTNITGTNEYGKFEISSGVVAGVVLDGTLAYLKFAADVSTIAFSDITLKNGGNITFVNATIDGMNIVDNMATYYEFGADNKVSNLSVVNALIKFTTGNEFNGVKLDSGSIAVMYENGTINNLEVDGGTTWTQFTTGTITGTKLMGGKIEAAGNLTLDGILIDGTKYNTEIGDTADTSKDHQTTQLVAYAFGVTIKNMRIQSGGSAFLYNNAYAEGAGSLEVVRGEDGYVATKTAGVVVDSGGVLYMTNWDLSTDIEGGYVDGDLWVNGGGTLYLGTKNFTITGKIQTMGGSTITGIASGTTIDSIILRGANIMIDEKLTINDAIQGAAQSVDGGTVVKWTNNYGILTMNSGVIENYINNNATGATLIMNGGTIENLDLAKSKNANYILGGVVNGGSAGLAGAIITDVYTNAEGVKVYGSATINNIVVGGTGGYVAGTWSWDGAIMEVFSDNSVANNITLAGGLLNIGRYDQGLVGATANDITVNSGILRVDAKANNVTMTGGSISLYGGVIDGLNLTGGIVANYGTHRGTINNATLDVTETNTKAINITAGLVDWDRVTIGAGFEGYTTFGSQSTVNNLSAYSAVAIGNCTTVTNASLYGGAVMTNYGGATVTNLSFYDKGTWAQFTTGVTNELYLYDETKYEAAGTNKVNGAVVDAFGVDVEFKEIKVGAHLVLYAADVVANDVSLINKGSATVYNGATINNVTASDGGALYMVDWNGNTPAIGGTANNVTITSTGAFWYKGGTVNNITIDKGATIDITANFMSKISGTYTNIDGIGDLGYKLNGDGTGTFVAIEGVTFLGNWGTGIGGTVNLNSLWLFEGASMVGWNLGASTVNGQYVDGDGNIHKMTMGGTNEFGGKHAQNVYIYNGSAVLGSGSAKVDEESGDVTITYNTATGLIFDNSLFVLGGMTKVTDTTFRNGVSFQGYSNGNISGTNYDEAADSIYRNFSLEGGVASGMIIENGGFLQGFYAGQNWGGTTPSPAASFNDIIVRGVRSSAGGNYDQSMMNLYNGGSYITLSNDCSGKNIIVGSGAVIRTLNAGSGTMNIEDLTIEAGGVYMFENINTLTNIMGSYAGKEFSVSGGYATDIVMDNDRLVFTATEGMIFENGKFTAGKLNLVGSGMELVGDTYIGISVDASKFTKLGGSLYLKGVDFALAAGQIENIGLTKLTIDGGTFSTQDNNLYNADVDIINGAKVSWVGGGAGDKKTINVSGAGSKLTMSWQHAGWGQYSATLNVTDGAEANLGASTNFSAMNLNGGGVYVSGNGVVIGTATVTDGWLQYDGAANNYTGNVSVVGVNDAKTYFQLIGKMTGTTTLSGSGAVYVGSGNWGAGQMEGGLTVTSNDKTKGNVCLRNGVLNGLDMNGGTFWYSGSYRIEDVQAEVTLAGKVSFVNAIINSGLENTITIDMSKVTSLKIGNYTDVNASIDASSVQEITLGAGGTIAEGKSITVGYVNAFDFTGAKSFVVDSLLASHAGQIIVAESGAIEIGTITVHSTEGVYNLGDAANLDLASGITINVGAAQSAIITAFNEKFHTNASSDTTVTVKITVDENNQATLTVFRTSSEDKVIATWPTSWTNAPMYNIPVTEDDIKTYAVDGVIGLQEAGPSAQAKFLYRDPATNTNSNIAMIGKECNGAYVIAGMVKPNAWGARANTWLEVAGAQKVTVIGGGTAEGGKLTEASNIYVHGADTSASIYGAGGAGFTVGAVNIQIEDSTINRLFGGGYADGNWDAAKVISGKGYGGDVLGDINIAAKNATFQRVVVGGGYGNVGGNINIEINDAVRSAANFYGGTFNTVVDTTVGGNVNLSINGGTFSGMFVGGSYVSGAVTSNISGATNITLNGVKQLNAYRPDFSETAWVIGGGYSVVSGNSNVVGSSTISIVNSIVGYVVGGGAATDVNTSAIIAETNIFVKGSTISGSIYGGAYSNLLGNGSVLGDTSITIDSSKLTSIYGNIYAGGKGTNSTVGGDATITFTGKSELLNFSGLVSGSGNITGIVGTSNLVFRDFNGEFSATVTDFDMLSFAGNSVVDLNTITINGLESINFDLSGRGIDFAQDALVSGGQFTFSDTADLMIDGVDKFTSDASFVLMDGISDSSIFDDAMINLAGFGSFNLGETFDIDGYGSFTASLENDSIKLTFTAIDPVDGNEFTKKSLLA